MFPPVTFGIPFLCDLSSVPIASLQAEPNNSNFFISATYCCKRFTFISSINTISRISAYPTRILVQPPPWWPLSWFLNTSVTHSQTKNLRLNPTSVLGGVFLTLRSHPYVQVLGKNSLESHRDFHPVLVSSIPSLSMTFLKSRDNTTPPTHPGPGASPWEMH